MVEKTIPEINQKIKDGSATVVTAEEMTNLVKELGPRGAAKEVDVVTTGTFGAMCSSGAFLNFGHSEPPIKMLRAWLNDVEAYAGLAAVDVYIGATQISETLGMEYGGGHVIEDLVDGKSVELKATAHGTDCYPRQDLGTTLTLEDINQAIMLNPRNAYERYNVATNSSDRTLYTYMGTLLPDNENATYSGAGCLSPLHNDPEFETIGAGTRIFLCGAQGHVVSEGTQHDPGNRFGTIMVTGNLKEMTTTFLRGATFHKYGTTLYVGLGVPIPVLNERIAARAGISDDDIVTSVLDYSVPSRSRPILRQVSYAELKSGVIEVDGREVQTSSLSSFYKAREVAETLKSWIEKGEFTLSEPAKLLPTDRVFKPMKQTLEMSLVRDVMITKFNTIRQELNVDDAARVIFEGEFTHLPVISEDNKLVGVITAWDVSKAVATGKHDKLDQVMTREVITVIPDDDVHIAAWKMEKYNISALPVIDEHKNVVGILRSDDLSRLFASRKPTDKGVSK